VLTSSGSYCLRLEIITIRGISSIVPSGPGFRITGTGFQAGTLVYANYSFYINSDPSNLEQALSSPRPTLAVIL